MDFQCKPGDHLGANLFDALLAGMLPKELLLEEVWEHIQRCSHCKKEFTDVFEEYKGDSDDQMIVVRSTPSGIHDPKTFLAALMTTISISDTRREELEELLQHKLADQDNLEFLLTLLRSFARVLVAIDNKEPGVLVQMKVRTLSSLFERASDRFGGAFTTMVGLSEMKHEDAKRVIHDSMAKTGEALSDFMNRRPQ